MNSWIGLLVVYIYVSLCIGFAEILRRRFDTGSTVTRKVIHVGVGMLSWLLPLLFDSAWPFVFACGTFVLITFIDRRYAVLSVMFSEDRSNLGTIYFPIAAAIVVLVFWETPPLMVASLMPLTWGDGLASVVGSQFGKTKYRVRGHERTLEGSATFFVTGGFFTWLAMWAVPGHPDMSPLLALAPALLVITTTTLAEAVSIRGLDNLTITFTAAIVLSLWRF